MGDYIELTDLTQRVPFAVQVDLADDKDPGAPKLTDAQISELRTAIAGGTTPTDTRLAAIITILTGVIRDGEAQVNRYLGYQYAASALPLTGSNITGIIKAHSLTFAAWYLHGRRQNIPDDIQAMFEDASEWGESLKPTADGASPTTVATPSPSFVGADREFSQATLKYW